MLVRATWISSASRSDFPDAQCKKHSGLGGDLNWKRPCPVIPQSVHYSVFRCELIQKKICTYFCECLRKHRYSNGAQFVLDMHLAHMVRFSTTAKFSLRAFLWLFLLEAWKIPKPLQENQCYSKECPFPTCLLEFPSFECSSVLFYENIAASHLLG